MWHADKGRLFLRTPGPVPLGLAYVLLVETKLNPFSELVVIFPDYALRTSLGTFRFCLVLHNYGNYIIDPKFPCSYTVRSTSVNALLYDVNIGSEMDFHFIRYL